MLYSGFGCRCFRRSFQLLKMVVRTADDSGLSLLGAVGSHLQTTGRLQLDPEVSMGNGEILVHRFVYIYIYSGAGLRVSSLAWKNWNRFLRRVKTVLDYDCCMVELGSAGVRLPIKGLLSDQDAEPDLGGEGRVCVFSSVEPPPTLLKCGADINDVQATGTSCTRLEIVP